MPPSSSSSSRSCDDSCAAVVAGPSHLPRGGAVAPSSSYEVLSQAIAHQDHSSTGGIHPYTAALSHAANLPATIARALREAGISSDGADIDAIAVTQGPGMASSLGVGLTAAKTLAAAWDKDIIYIHHMAAHALTPLLTEKDPPTFPFLTLLVSGGHTMLVLATSPTQYRLLATTTDDSIGDAFDKVARALNIDWGGDTGFTNPGAALEAFASLEEAESFQGEMPRFPVPSPGSMMFSYSGIKSAVLRYIDTHLPLQAQTAASSTEQHTAHRRAIARAFQQAAIGQIEDRVALAFGLKEPRRPTPGRVNEGEEGEGHSLEMLDAESKKAADLVCSGGVASNSYLRHRLTTLLNPDGTPTPNERPARRLHFPPLSLCTDNAVMIAFAGHLMWERRTRAFDRHARPKWSLEDL